MKEGNSIFPALQWLCTAAGVVGAILLAGCAIPPAHEAIDPQTDFAAHGESQGLVIDRNTDGSTGVVTAGHATPFSRGPQMLVQSGGVTVAALWLRDLDHVAVRHSSDASAPVTGWVESSWSGRKLRLTLHTADGTTYTTSRFRRVEPRRVPPALEEDAEMRFDVDGVYVADLRNDKGRQVGWLRVQIDPSSQPARVYDGELPHSVDPALLTAATTLLDVDVSDLKQHTTDVHLGN